VREPQRRAGTRAPAFLARVPDGHRPGDYEGMQLAPCKIGLPRINTLKWMARRKAPIVAAARPPP